MESTKKLGKYDIAVRPMELASDKVDEYKALITEQLHTCFIDEDETPGFDNAAQEMLRDHERGDDIKENMSEGWYYLNEGGVHLRFAVHNVEGSEAQRVTLSKPNLQWKERAIFGSEAIIIGTYKPWPVKGTYMSLWSPHNAQDHIDAAANVIRSLVDEVKETYQEEAYKRFLKLTSK